MEPRDAFRQVTSDAWLLFAALGLSLLGVVMVYSTTSHHSNPMFFLHRQLQCLMLGMIAMIVATYFPIRHLRSLSGLFLLLCFGLFVMLLVGFGVRAGGAIRWLEIGGVRLGQPSEIAKIAVVLYLADRLASRQDRIHEFIKGFLPPIVVILLLVALLMKQPDFGTSMMILSLMGILLFVGGVRKLYLFGSAVFATPIVFYLILSKEYRAKRLLAFLDPFSKENITGSAYQLVQSLKAFASGGLQGAGLGAGRQKIGYLPEAHTDFIFAVVGEEMGLMGVLLILTLFLLVLYRGFRIAMRSRNLFQRLVAVGVTSLIGLQGVINMGVVMGLLPTKGMPLPFLSFARTSQIVILGSIGLLLQIEYLNQKDREQSLAGSQTHLLAFQDTGQFDSQSPISGRHPL
jgi:cell division protein FtsW